MIDTTGRAQAPLYALLHGGGGGLPMGNSEAAVRPKNFYQNRAAFGGVAATMGSISLMPPNPSTKISPRVMPGRRPAPACCTSNRASSEQSSRAWAVKPEGSLQFKDGAATDSVIVDASQLKPRQTMPRTGPPKLATADRPVRSVPGRRQGPGGVLQPPLPPREANTPGHARIAAVRRRNAREARAAVDGWVESSVPEAAITSVLAPVPPSSSRGSGSASSKRPGSRGGGGASGATPPMQPEAAAEPVAAATSKPAAAAAAASAAGKAPVARNDDAPMTLRLMTLDDGEEACVRVRLRIGGEDEAAAQIQQAHRAKKTAQREREVKEARESDEKLEAARNVLRENELYFERMKAELDAQLREESAAKIQAISRGRQDRSVVEERKKKKKQ